MMFRLVTVLTALLCVASAEDCFNYKAFEKKLFAVTKDCAEKNSNKENCEDDFKKCVRKLTGFFWIEVFDHHKFIAMLSEYAREDVKKLISGDLAHCSNERTLFCVLKYYKKKCPELEAALIDFAGRLAVAMDEDCIFYFAGQFRDEKLKDSNI